jgi:hypothetical protein
MVFKSYVKVLFAVTIPPIAAAAALLARIASRGPTKDRADDDWFWILWLAALFLPLLAEGLQRLLWRGFDVYLPTYDPAHPRRSSRTLLRWIAGISLGGGLVLGILYVRVCSLAGWRKLSDDWKFDRGDRLLGDAIGAAFAELWPFVLLLLCVSPWLAALAWIRIKETDQSWEHR